MAKSASLESELRKIFTAFDKNADGLICKNDLRLLLSKTGSRPSDEDLTKMMNSVDDNGDGCINFEEFLNMLCSSEQSDAESEEELLDAFRVFDKNNDGFISAEELQSVLERLGVLEGAKIRDCRRIVQNVDLDGDGKIGFSDFKSMMMRNPSSFICCI